MAAFDVAQGGGSASTTSTPSQPSTTQVGDLLLVTNMVDGSTSLSLAFSAGTPIRTIGFAQPATYAAWWVRATVAGAASLGTLSWDGASRYNAWSVTRIPPGTFAFDPASPIADSVAQANASSTSMVFGAVSPATTGCLSVLLGGIDNAASCTAPAGYTSQQDNTIGSFVATGDSTLASGSSGTKTVTLSVARATAAIHVAITPAPAPPPPAVAATVLGSIMEQFPLRLLIGEEDCTYLLDQSFSFSNVDPGGYESASFQIPKDMPETLVGQYVRLDCGLSVAWEGRISQIQRSLGSRTTLTCEGYGAVLKETSVAMIFVDRDMSGWSGPSVQRMIGLVASSKNALGGTVAADPVTGQPSLVNSIQGSWASPISPLAEAWYDAQGLAIASLYYAWKINNQISPADPNWSWIAGLSTDDIVTVQDATSELRAAGPGSGTLTATAANRKFGHVRLLYGVTPGGLAGNEYDLFWTCLAVYGNHGLTKRGSNSPTDAQGFYTSDIAQWVVSQAPELQAGVIPDATAFIVRHAAYKTATPLEQMLAEQAKYIGCHWGVWESLAGITGDSRPRLDFRPYPTSATAWCYRRDCEGLDLNEQLAKLYDTAIVAYTDTSGVQRSVTVTMSNPLLNAAGISGRVLPVNGGVMTPASAQSFGQLMLVLLLLQARVAGTTTITGLVNTDGGRIPPYLLKSGIDRLRIVDLPGSDAWGTYNNVPVTRVEASGTSAGITTNVELGTGADLTEALQAQLAEQATILGV